MDVNDITGTPDLGMTGQQPQGNAMPFTLPAELAPNNGTGQQAPQAPQIPQAPSADVSVEGNEKEVNETIALLSFPIEQLSTEQLEIRNGVFDLVKATGVNQTGDLVNAEGKVVLNKEQLKTYIAEDKLPVNAEGKQTNALGEVIETTVEADDIISDIKSSFEQEYGIKLEGEFPDTIEGIQELVKTTVTQLNTTAVKDFLLSNPETFDFYKHIATGGTYETFNPTSIDYASIKVDDLDNDTKINYIRTMFTKQGLPNVDNMLELIKGAGEKQIKTSTAEALLFLNKQQSLDKQQKDSLFQQQLLKEQEEEKQYWQAAKKVVDNGKINNVTIPVAERQAFFDYLNKPIDKKGNTQDIVKSESDTLEFQLLTSYLRYKNYDISKLAANIAKENKVLSLRERYNKQSGQQVISPSTHNVHNTPASTVTPLGVGQFK